MLNGCSEEDLFIVYDAPKGEKASEDYRVFVNGVEVFCYEGQVYDTRFTEGYHFGEEGLPWSKVSFAYFDFSGNVEVTIQTNSQVYDAAIRPLASGIQPEINGNKIVVTIRNPGSYTIEPDGNEHRVLHLFANPVLERPDMEDENLIYFGPGEHVVNTIQIMDNQTLFIDGGAVVHFEAFADDPIYRIEERHNGSIMLKRYDHGIEATDVKNIKIVGRGILDFSRIAEINGRKNPVHINNCENVEIEGVIIRGANCWHITVYRSQNVLIDNIKEIAWGFNTDGINILVSQDVHIRNCFMRQRDDGIVMKAMDTGNTDAFITEEKQPAKLTSNVLVEDCVIWSDWGYAMGITYEIRMPVEDITFRNCHIIHATHAVEGQGVIGILVADSSHVSNVVFENITIERSLKPLIKLEQKITPWTINNDLGYIKDIKFINIRYLEGEQCPIIFEGFSERASIENIHLEGLVFLGNEINRFSDWDFRMNEYVSDVFFKR